MPFLLEHIRSSLCLLGGPSDPGGYKEGSQTQGRGRATASQPWSCLKSCRLLLLMKCVFKVNLWERMAHVGDYKQMTWLPVLVVSRSQHLCCPHCTLDQESTHGGPGGDSNGSSHPICVLHQPNCLGQAPWLLKPQFTWL